MGNISELQITSFAPLHRACVSEMLGTFDSERTLTLLYRQLMLYRYEVALHAQRVSSLVQRVCRHLSLSDEETSLIALAALFHDIGKLRVPAYILHKSGQLTTSDWTWIRRHPEFGYQMLTCAGAVGEKLAPLVATHHECWDGSGYPLGLKGNAIPQGTRLLSLVDAYDAMTSRRPYRQPLHARAIQTELQNGIGRQFDPYLCRALLNMLNEEPDMFVLHTSEKLYTREVYS